MKHSNTRSLPTCHRCGIVGHIKQNCGQLNSWRPWNKKDTPKKEKDVEELSKPKYVLPHKRQSSQRVVLSCYHCNITGHMRPHCPHIQAQMP